MTYNEQFSDIINKIDNILNFDQIYESETGFTFDKNKKGNCPFCGSGTHGGRSSDGAFTFHQASNKARCFSCGTNTGIIKLITHTHNCSYKESIHYIAANYLNTTLTDPGEEIQINKFKPKKKIEISERKKASLAELKKEEEQKKKSYLYISGLILAVEDKTDAITYLQSRAIDTGNLPDNTFYQASPYKELPAGVVFFDSEKRCLNKRYIVNELPKNVAKTFTFGEMLNSVFDKTFRADNEKVYITEGVINALSIYQCENSAISLFASTNYITEVEKFKSYFADKHIIIAFDFDKGGQQSAIKQANFIINNFSIKSLSTLLFPADEDANDLHQKKALAEYLNIKYHYSNLTKKTINYHLKEIEKDQKNYFPTLRADNYYNRPAVKKKEQDKQLIDVREVLPEDLLERFKGSDQLNESTFNDFNIYYLKEYTIIDNKTAHIHISTPENPIFLIHHSKELQIIWRPFAGKPYNEFDFHGTKPDDFNIGYQQIEDKYEDNKTDPDSVNPKLEKVTIAYNLRDLLNLAAIEEFPLFFTGKELSYDVFEKLQGYAETIYQAPTLKNIDLIRARNYGMKHIDICTINVPQLNGYEFNTISDFLKQYSSGFYKKQLNTALPFKFWEYEKGDYDISIIKLRNFLSARGYFTYTNELEKQGYMYIKINGRIVEHQDKDIFPRYIESEINHYLEARGETSKLRDKITTSNRFNERFLSGIKQIKLDFENSGRDYQNWFFDDGTMWTVTKNGITQNSQKSLKKYVWKEELLKCPSTILKKSFKIFFREDYAKALANVKKTATGTPEYATAKKQLRNFKSTEIYDIEIIDRNSYFLQYLFLTSYVYWQDVERKGIVIKATDFWYNLDKVLTPEQISEMKLHLINKLTWLGYYMRDHKDMADDYGLAILDAVDNEPGLRKGGSAGGGKSLITKALAQVKRVLILAAENEDFPEDKHRYENYDGQKILVCDDMHLKSRIGNMLTDISAGITVNPKHKKPRTIPFIDSPKFIFTRNYIDDEGERVDRRIGRMFVYPFFHDGKSGRHAESRKPNEFFGRMLFQDDTEEDKSKLVNLFAECYQANRIYGEINPPMTDMEKFRLIRRIGEPLIEYLDVLFEDEQGYGYIDRVPLFLNFKDDQRLNMNSYQRTSVYNTSQKFKMLVDDYCKLRDLIINPQELITDKERNRIVRTSETQQNKHGHQKSSEHFYINTKEGFLKDIEHFEKTGDIKTDADPQQLNMPEPDKNPNDEDDLPF